MSSIHVKQKFVAEGKPCSALEAAVHEGVASIFEREYAGSEPEYVQYDSNKTTQWYGQLKLVAPEIYFEESGETFRKFAFHDPEDGEDWKVYKTGVWLVEKFMYAKNLKIIDMIDIPAKDVIQFYEMTGVSLK